SGRFLLFSFSDAAHIESSTLSLHDALPIYRPGHHRSTRRARATAGTAQAHPGRRDRPGWRILPPAPRGQPRRCPALRARHVGGRSEEHTSELQSRENLVCRLLLEKKKQNKK